MSTSSLPLQFLIYSNRITSHIYHSASYKPCQLAFVYNEVLNFLLYLAELNLRGVDQARDPKILLHIVRKSLPTKAPKSNPTSYFAKPHQAKQLLFHNIEMKEFTQKISKKQETIPPNTN